MYSAGDLVRITDFPKIVPRMKRYLGCVTFVEKVAFKGAYWLQCDNCEYLWYEDWLSPGNDFPVIHKLIENLKNINLKTEQTETNVEFISSDEFNKLLQEK